MIKLGESRIQEMPAITKETVIISYASHDVQNQEAQSSKYARFFFI
jgi:hypothetical protein